MKSSVGVTLCAVVVLIGSALTLVAAAGAAFVFLGPMSSQLFDPASLPPGADVRTMRAFGAGGAAMLGVFGSLGIATGIGLIRLWRWARYSAMICAAFLAFFAVISAAGVLLVPMPAAQSNVPATFIYLMAGVYLLFAAAAGGFIYFLARRATAAQFDGQLVAPGPRTRPLAVTVIAWIMLVSGLMMLPSVLLITLPAVFLGFVFTGGTAKAFYVIYMLAYLVIGAGLLKRTAQTLPAAIGLHGLMIVNALIMLVPSVWQRYHTAVTSMSTLMASQPTSPWAQYSGVVFGMAYGGVIVYFLDRARRTMNTPNV